MHVFEKYFGGFKMKLLKAFLWVLPLLYMMMIWRMSSLPSNAYVELPDTNVDRFIKESLHLVEFAILYLLFVLAAYFNEKLTATTSLIFAIVACLYGLTDEIHQSFVPARSATLIDLIKDVIGVSVAYYFVRKKLLRIKVVGDCPPPL
jgi:VanZ family protein